MHARERSMRARASPERSSQPREARLSSDLENSPACLFRMCTESKIRNGVPWRKNLGYRGGGGQTSSGIVSLPLSAALLANGTMTLGSSSDCAAV